MAEEIIPFRIDVPDADLADLRERLRRTRWPDRETVDDWSQGAPLAWVQDLCQYWASGYDWRAREARLNSFPQFRTTIDRLDMHFLHVRSRHDGALPLILTSGWPGSVTEFSHVIGPLTDPAGHGGDPADAFHVVCPSLPGYGFSGKPAGTGWNVQRIAAAWAALMARLGYRRYGAQGHEAHGTSAAGGDARSWGHFLADLPRTVPESSAIQDERSPARRRSRQSNQPQHHGCTSVLGAILCSRAAMARPSGGEMTGDLDAQVMESPRALSWVDCFCAEPGNLGAGVLHLGTVGAFRGGDVVGEVENRLAQMFACAPSPVVRG